MRDGELVDPGLVMIVMMRRRVPVITLAPDLIITGCQAVITDH